MLLVWKSDMPVINKGFDGKKKEEGKKKWKKQLGRARYLNKQMKNNNNELVDFLFCFEIFSHDDIESNKMDWKLKKKKNNRLIDKGTPHSMAFKTLWFGH